MINMSRALMKKVDNMPEQKSDCGAKSAKMEK